MPSNEERSRKRAAPRAGTRTEAKINSAPATAPSPSPDPYSSNYDFLLVNSPITNGLIARVMRCVSVHKQNSKVVVLLVSYGGLANEAYRVGKYLQSVYDDVVAFVPSYCKSAGTLIVCAANSVVISPFGEIGPLDVQLLQRDEIFGRRSGLTTRSALDDLKTHTFELFQEFMLNIVAGSSGAVSFKLASDISAKVAADVMSRVYEQINPDALGQDFRDLTVATKYCERLERKFRNLKPGAIKRLVHEYPSHDFVIDTEEAEDIFVRLNEPTPTLYDLMTARMSDVMLPRSSKPGLIEMLRIDGSAMTSKDATRRSRAEAKNASDATTGSSGDDGTDAASA